MKKFFNLKFILILVFLVTITTIVSPLLQSSFRVNAKEKITITEFQVPTDSNNSGPYFITSGPDGNLWFTKYNVNKIGKITPKGKITEFVVPSGPGGITSTPDSNLWFTEVFENKIVRFTLSGDVTEFSIPTNNSGSYKITFGTDGNIWFAEYGANKIGRITPNGIITEFVIPTDNSGPQDITAGPDGNLWFTEYYANKIGRITTSGEITEFVIPTNNSTPLGITAGPDGNIWFTEYNTYKIGRITPNGEITEFIIPIGNNNSNPNYITSAPDGNLWYTRGFKIGRITPNGEITEFSPPTKDSNLLDIITGPDGNIWYTDVNSHTIGRVNLSSLKDPGPPDMDFDLLSPFNNGVTWSVVSGYYNNRNQSTTECHIGIGPDHCRNQLFGLDMVPNPENDTEILAPGNGKVSFRGKLEGGCIGLRITLDNGLNLNVCHFATWNVNTGDRVLRGKVLGTRSTPHVHLSLDDRYRIGTLCPKGQCFLPIPFDGQHTLEGMSLNPDPNGETVTLPYPLCGRRNASCQFKVVFQQYQDLQGISSNIAIP
ncbi:MAG: hypothetical protein AAB521_02845 [Patescibacteria group bacterium]